MFSLVFLNRLRRDKQISKFRGPGLLNSDVFDHVGNIFRVGNYLPNMGHLIQRSNVAEAVVNLKPIKSHHQKHAQDDEPDYEGHT